MALPPLPNLPPALPPSLGVSPRLAEFAAAKWKVENQGKDKLHIVIDATLTRADAFRLIGELERMAAFL